MTDEQQSRVLLESDTMSEEFTPLLARQPILDSNLNVVGYELLCRPVPSASAEWQDNFGDRATSEVIIGAFNDLGIEFVTGGLPAYINFTRYWLENPPLLGPSPVVAEVLEHIEIDDALIRSVRKLRKLKYQIALDDYLCDPLPQALLDQLDIIKLDLRLMNDMEKIRQTILRYQRPGLRWLAEKVETMEEFEACKAAGCNLFQGYFYARPNIMYGRRMPDNKLSVLKLLKVLNQPDAEVDEVTRILQSDPQLSFKLLQMVNSAYIGCAKEVTSIPRAIMIIGFDRIRAWANIIALGRLNDKPSVLREQAVARASLGLFLARAWPRVDPETAFTLGLFSLLDAFVDIPIDYLCDRLNLTDDLKRALVHREGDEGELLNLVIRMEQGDWQAINTSTLNNPGIQDEWLANTYALAIRHARELISVLD